MALSTTQIQQLYTAYLNRPADQAGVNYWQEQGVSEFELRANLANDNQPEYVELFGDLTREELVTAIYQNMFGRDPEEAGLEYWVNGDGASVPASELQQLFISAASEEDTAAFNAKVAEQESNITPLPGTDETIRLTQQADDLEGADGVNTTFHAPVTQNETGSGALANTFETGDVLDGGANSTNVLRADLIASGAVSDSWAPAISAETTNIQEVYFRAQSVRQDNSGSNTTFGSTIDAEKMVGVEQWWTDNSRADVRIEDVRSRPVDTTLGMRLTDPGVGFEVYFNPLFMDGGQSSQSQLVIQIAELDGGAVNSEAQLENISVSALTFELAGESVTLASDAMAAANEWSELEAAIVEALADEGLGDLQVTRGNNGEFLLFDAEGRAFSNQGGFTASATTDQQIDIRNRITQDVQTQEEQTETDLVLDGAGNGSRGGAVNIAAMSGDRGVEVINVIVDRDSGITSLSSVNSPNTGNRSFDRENQLEEVYVTHLADGSMGDLQLGLRTVDSNGVSTTTDDRLQTQGLTDVRVFDAAGYESEIKLGAQLTASVFDKYLAGAEEPVQFSYLLGDGGNNFSLAVDNTVAADGDFALEIVGGAEDDRVNLSGLAVKDSTSVDGAGGANTVEINTTTGATADFSGSFATGNAVEYSAADTAFAGFENVDKLIVAGGNDTRQNIVDGNLTAIDGQEIVIATDLGASTDIAEARIDTELTISGKNQTLGSGNNNNDQFVGVVNVLDTRGIPNRSDLDVTLDNTARLDGELTVAELNVGTTAGGSSAVRTLDLSSSGRRSTENLVQSASLAGVNTVNLDGSQNLDLHIASMASGASVVDGSDLGGDLDLAMNAGILNGATDVLTGTAAETDTLAVYGTDAQATVTGFETVQLGLALDNQFNGTVTGFGGTFNAAAVSGVDQYNLVALSGAVELVNLSGSEVVNVSASNADQDMTFIAADRANGNEITVNFAGDYSSDLSIQDYRTVNLDLAANTNYDFSLDLETENGTNAGSTYARTLEISGGGLDANGNVNTTLEIGALDTALTVIDLSGYAGSLEGGTWASNNGSNAQILVNAYDFSFDVSGDAGATDFITEFRFATDADSFGSVWQIDSFQVFGSGATLQDRTLINLRDIGLSETDVSWGEGDAFWAGLSSADQQAFIDAGNDLSNLTNTDTVVTSNNDGDNFTIVLTGVTQSELNDENFLYSVA